MYCSNCGAAAVGNFCSQCGGALAVGDAPVGADWKNEVRYNVLLHFPEVRDLIAQHAGQAKKGITGEQFLGICDKIFAPKIPYSTMASIAQPLYARLGIRTGKERTEAVPSPVGKTLIAAVCSLARHGWKLKNVEQAEDGCVLEASLPSDLFSLEGELVVSVRRHGTTTQVEAATKIPGQLYDWGKSNRCLDRLFGDLQTLVN